VLTSIRNTFTVDAIRVMPDTQTSFFGSPAVTGEASPAFAHQLSLSADLIPLCHCGCGKPIPPSIHKRKFFSKECKTRDCNRRNRLKEQEQQQRNEVFFGADPKPSKVEWHAEAAEMYRRGIGHPTIAKALGRSKTSVRRALILTGVYAPLEKHKGIKRKGQGYMSRILQRQRTAEKQEKDKSLRMIAAAALRAMRKGVKLEAFCRAQGVTYPGALHPFLSRRESYAILRRKNLVRPKGFWSDEYRRRGERSNKFKDEVIFQSCIAGLLTGADIHYITEYDVGGSRADFKIDHKHIAEAKVQTNCKAVYALIGQLLHARTCEPSVSLMAIIPSDCTMKPTLYDALRATGAVVCTELTLLNALGRQKLAGQNMPGPFCLAKTNSGSMRHEFF
jgi:hypothetical protein